jgi:hypothetical protein
MGVIARGVEVIAGVVEATADGVEATAGGAEMVRARPFPFPLPFPFPGCAIERDETGCGAAILCAPTGRLIDCCGTSSLVIMMDPGGALLPRFFPEPPDSIRAALLLFGDPVSTRGGSGVTDLPAGAIEGDATVGPTVLTRGFASFWENDRGVPAFGLFPGSVLGPVAFGASIDVTSVFPLPPLFPLGEVATGFASVTLGLPLKDAP